MNETGLSARAKRRGPRTAGVSQAKWHLFRQVHALNGMKVYDQASRGPWGALRLLWNIRLRQESTMGFLLLRTSTATFSVEGGINSIQDYIYGVLFGVEDFILIPSCTSGNYTQDLYQTLAVCSQCVNITDQTQYVDAQTYDSGTATNDYDLTVNQNKIVCDKNSLTLTIYMYRLSAISIYISHN